MLKIRMQRTGRINIPSYRLVVVEHTASPKAGKFVELVGNYNPKSKVKNLKADRIKYWMSVGAKPSDTVHNMLVSEGILDAKKINVLPSYKEPAKEEVAAAPAVEAATEQATIEVATEAIAAASALDSGEPKEATPDAPSEEQKETPVA